jgi:hypothetical protein
MIRAHMRLGLLCAVLACGGQYACGGGGGAPDHPNPPNPRHLSTTFTGNLLSAAAPRSFDDNRGQGAATAVQVCVEGTNFCTEVDADGVFTLDASVSGDIVLVFDGPDFNARLPLNGVPAGATVRIRDIVCSTTSGQCRAADLQIVAAPNLPPICDTAVASPEVVWPPNHGLVRIAIDGVSDPDGDAVVITATDVAQDEPVDAEGSGNTGPDAQLAPLAVRAERSGMGNGRVYTITFVADDQHGGTCTGVVQVCVPHDRGRGAACVDDGSQFDSL